MTLDIFQVLNDEVVTDLFWKMLEQVAQRIYRSVVASTTGVHGQASFIEDDCNPALRLVGSGEDRFVEVMIDVKDVVW